MKTFTVIIGSLLCVLTVVLLVPDVASAQGPGFYIGAGAGMSETDWPGMYGNFDDQDTAMKAFFGYAFNKGFALEAGYADLGSFVLNPDTADPTIRLTQEPTAAYLAGVGTVELSDHMGLIVKIGLAMWDMDAELSQAPLSISGTEDGLDTMFGIGFQFDLKPVLVRIEYEQYQDVGDSVQLVPPPPDSPLTIDGTDVDVFGLSVAFLF